MQCIVSGMAKTKRKPNRERPTRAVTISTEVVKLALAAGKLRMPPLKSLSRIIDEALADWAVKYGPKGKGAK
jgi:hypothetical protein